MNATAKAIIVKLLQQALGYRVNWTDEEYKCLAAYQDNKEVNTNGKHVRNTNSHQDST